MKKIIVLAICATFASCEQVIDYKLPNEGSKLTMQTLLTQGDSIGVLISESSYTLDPASPRAGNDYKVYLYEGNTVIDTLIPRYYTEAFNFYNRPSTDVYKYYSKILPSSGKTYRIEASKQGLTSINGTTTLPNMPTINLVSGDTVKQEYELEIVDNATQSDKYLLRCIVEANEFTDEQPTYFAYTDPSIQSFDLGSDDPFDSELESFAVDAYISGESFSNGKKIVRFRVENFFGFEEGNNFRFEVTKVTNDYFKFKVSLAAYGGYFDLFSEPVQIYTNIENGYGIVGGGGKTEIKLENK